MVAGHLAVTEHAEHHELRGGATQENVITVFYVLEPLLIVFLRGTGTKTIVPFAIGLGVVCDGGENHQEYHDQRKKFFTHNLHIGKFSGESQSGLIILVYSIAVATHTQILFGLYENSEKSDKKNAIF